MSFFDRTPDAGLNSAFAFPHIEGKGSKAFLSSLFRDSATKTDRAYHKTDKSGPHLSVQDFMSDAQFEAHLKMLTTNGDFSKPSAEDVKRAKLDTIASRTDKGGLFNLGNTCWLNSLFQLIKHSKAYLPLVRERAESGDDESVKLLAQAICNVIDLSEKDVSEDVNTQLYEQIEFFLELLAPHRPDLTNGRQHDPNEALLFIVDFLNLDRDLPKITKRSFFKAVHSDLQHHKEESDASEQITLANVRMSSIQKGLLEEYMSAQRLDEDNKILFEGSAERQLAYKIDYFTTDSTPIELVIQAPRFLNGPIRRLADGQVHSDRFKNTSHIIFEPQIQIPLYCRDGSRVEKVLTLELDTVSGHSGSLAGGHYVAYHNNGDGTFTCYNDARVTKLTYQQAFREIQEKGYLATYRVVDDKPSRIELKTLDQVIPSTLHVHPPAQEVLHQEHVALDPADATQVKEKLKPRRLSLKASSPSFEDDWDFLDDFSAEELEEQRGPALKEKTFSKSKVKVVPASVMKATSRATLGGKEPLVDPKKKKTKKDIERILALLTPTPPHSNSLEFRKFTKISAANQRFRF